MKPTATGTPRTAFTSGESACVDHIFIVAAGFAWIWGRWPLKAWNRIHGIAEQ